MAEATTTDTPAEARGLAAYAEVEQMLTQLDAQENGDDAGTGEEAQTGVEEGTADGGTPDTTNDDEPEADGEGAGWDSWVEQNVPDEYRDEFKRSTLRQADYSRKTQALADQRKMLEKQLGEVEKLKAQYEEIASTKSSSTRDADTDMDEWDEEGPPPGTPAHKIIEFYVKKHVQGSVPDLDALLEKKLGPISGDLETQKAVKAIEDAYMTFVQTDGTDVIFQDAEVAKAVGETIAGDEDLSDLALVDPVRAVKMAAKQVLRSRNSESKNKKRVASRDLGRVSRSGTTTPVKRKTALEAAQDALRAINKG